MSLRRMSAPSALLFKNLSGYRSKSSSSLWSNNSIGKKEHDLISQFKMADGESSRTFVMEGSVQFAAGMQIQERYLFLFNDLLLVTKQKSSSAFKLKHKVQLCDMWVASCIEDVAETTRPADRSFVIGWPTLNAVATFARPDIKECWLSKLKEYMQVEKLKDREKQMQLRVSPRDIESITRNVCQVTINNFTEAKDVLMACLNQLNISEHDSKDYQLWVLSGKEGSPYPLIGHETPFSIKLSHFRGLSRSRSGDDIDNMTAADLESLVTSNNSGQKCEFYLKQKKSSRKHHYEDSTLSKSAKKNKKSANIFHTLFRKKRPAQHLVFGLPLSEVCDENLDPPEAIIKLMVLVYQQGPHTPGILRRGNKATLSREIKAKIDSGDKYALEDHMAPTAASVFKEFLRSIPEGLLVNDLYAQWSTVKKDDPHGEKINKIKTILAKLPLANYRLIKLTVSLLQHLAKYSSHNQMGPSNLATCIAPSIYTRGENEFPYGNLKGEALKQMQMQDSVSEIQNVIVPLLSFMIIHHIEIFGEDILSLFTKYGCETSPVANLQEDKPETHMQPSLEEDEEDELAAEEEQDDEMVFNGQDPKQHHRLQLQQKHEQIQRDSNSGTDSDSMHSVLSMQETEMGLRHNDSSIDSLVDKEYYLHEAESSPKAVKSHISPSNLSRDSGLTLSDTQLYDEEACQGDTITVPEKMYQRSASHSVDHENIEAYHQNSYFQSAGSPFGRSINPVAPPRKRPSRKGRDSTEESDSEHHGFTTYFNQRAPFKHSLSTTQLENNSKITRFGELRPLLSHPLLSKRVSSDSIGEEGEIIDDQFHPIDFERMRAATDIGTVVKSDNGSHLFLNEQILPIKYSLDVSGNKSQHRFVRQSSVTDSTPPISPQSRYSQSSHDSAISDSVYSVSQDESIRSIPQTPDEQQNKSLDWVPDISVPDKPWAGMLSTHNSNQFAFPYSKSTSDLLSQNKVDDNTENSSEHEPKVKPFPKLWSGKFHEAEEIEVSGRPHLRLSQPRNYSIDPSFQVSLTTLPHNNVPYRRQGLPAHFDKGSPPPLVIIQTLQSLPKKDSVPVSHCVFSSKDSDPSMNSVRHEEYHKVKSKPIIIEPPGDSLSSSVSTASRRARLSKYMTSSVDLPLSSKDRDFILSESRNQDRPPNYQQALERKCILKNNMSLDKVHVRRGHESVKVNSEWRNSNPNEIQASHIKPPYQVPSETSDKLSSSQTNTHCEECSLLRYPSKGSAQSATGSEDIHQNRRSSGYLDMSSISRSVQKDVLGAVCSAQEEGDRDGTVDNRSVSLSSSDSKSSHITSSIGSSVPAHDKYLNFLGHQSSISDTSNSTVSSPVSRDISARTSSIKSKYTSPTDADPHNMAYSRHFCSVKPENNRKSDPDSEIKKDECENEDHTTVKKDPQKVYLQSMQIYEQKNSTTPPISNSPINVSLESSPSHPFPKQLQQHSSCAKFKSQQKACTLPSQDTISPKERSTDISYMNRSASVDHLNERGVYSPLSTRSRRGVLMHEQKIHHSDIRTSADKGSDIKPQVRDIKSELHQNFLRAKSCFSQSQTDQPASSAIPTHHLPQSTSSLENRMNKRPQSVVLAPTTEDMTVESALIPGFRTKVSSKQFSNPQSSVSENKKEIHWSVKDLKSIYDKSKDSSICSNSTNVNSSSSKEPISHLSSHSHLRSPPPYQNPPPFRNTQDSFLPNTSAIGSKESVGSSSSMMVSSHNHESDNYLKTHNSSEDSYNSTVDKNSTRLGNTSHDSEALSDYTNITYV